MRTSILFACLPACQSCYSCCCCCGSEGRARRTPRSRATKQPSSQEDAAQSTHRTPRMRLSLVYVFLNAMTTTAANKYQRADNDNDGHRRIGRENGMTMRYPAVCTVTQVANCCSSTKLRSTEGQFKGNVSTTWIYPVITQVESYFTTIKLS